MVINPIYFKNLFQDEMKLSRDAFSFLWPLQDSKLLTWPTSLILILLNSGIMNSILYFFIFDSKSPHESCMNWPAWRQEVKEKFCAWNFDFTSYRWCQWHVSPSHRANIQINLFPAYIWLRWISVLWYTQSGQLSKQVAWANISSFERLFNNSS